MAPIDLSDENGNIYTSDAEPEPWYLIDNALAYLQVINRALLREQLRMNPQTEAVSVS